MSTLSNKTILGLTQIDQELEFLVYLRKSTEVEDYRILLNDVTQNADDKSLAARQAGLARGRSPYLQ